VSQVGETLLSQQDVCKARARKFVKAREDVRAVSDSPKSAEGIAAGSEVLEGPGEVGLRGDFLCWTGGKQWHSRLALCASGRA
jgi:hypothetical protein